MSQNSLVLATSGTLSGLAAVEAVNAALDTLNTLAAGASAPSSPEAGQFWHDSGNNLLKLRSLDNTAWITLGILDETNHLFSAAVKAAPPIFGLTISNDATSPTSFIDVAMGGAYDSTAAFYMRLASSTRKNVTTAWSSGTGNGSLDTGSFQASKFYHVYLIYNAATSAVDILTSLSYNSPTLPSGYAYFVAIGAVYSNASANLTTFTQNGNEFIYATQFTDYNGASLNSTAQTVTLTVPLGCKIKARMRGSLIANDSSGTAVCALLVSSFDETDQVVNNYGPATLGIDAYNGVLIDCADNIDVRTNTSGQVRIRGNVNYLGCDIYLYTYGFEYPRGLQ
jgi:hypothetical protein